ncbi:hypothetical protein CDD81_8010 [Ophiocordyceps australis]|uniref:U4/U6.U5 small nuclear ribonucleoprotein 27kDa protein domain-containing protein n=1 Tax=Ophiocordyceps australis TaxID=1399860 RepID=A0A2C5XGG1_9HYPO|nr:hypothetical protein CDD81_8010 [Ophiocordyceps australis]
MGDSRRFRRQGSWDNAHHRSPRHRVTAANGSGPRDRDRRHDYRSRSPSPSRARRDDRSRSPDWRHRTSNRDRDRDRARDRDRDRDSLRDRRRDYQRRDRHRSPSPHASGPSSPALPNRSHPRALASPPPRRPFDRASPSHPRDASPSLSSQHAPKTGPRQPSKGRQAPTAARQQSALDGSAMQVDLDGHGEDDMAAMQALMGFGNFGSTKNTKVLGNNVGAVHKEKKTEYRQYMNRQGGFNRPLSPSR